MTVKENQTTNLNKNNRLSACNMKIVVIDIVDDFSNVSRTNSYQKDNLRKTIICRYQATIEIHIVKSIP